MLGAALVACRADRSAPSAAGAGAPHRDAGPAVRPIDAAPPRPSPEIAALLTQVLAVGHAPAVPPDLADLTPGTRRALPERDRTPLPPPRVLLDAPPTSARAVLDDDDVTVRALVVETRAPHLRDRLTAAWGPPALVASHPDTAGDAACWRVPARHLQVCHELAPYLDGGRDLVTYFRYVPIAETFAAGAPLAPERLVSYLGQSRRHLRKLLPSASDDGRRSHTSPALVLAIGTSGYRVGPAPDTCQIYFDDAGDADRIVIDFVVDDARRYDEAAAAVRAAAARAQGVGTDVIIGGARPRDVSLVVARPGP